MKSNFYNNVFIIDIVFLVIRDCLNEYNLLPANCWLIYCLCSFYFNAYVLGIRLNLENSLQMPISKSYTCEIAIF